MKFLNSKILISNITKVKSGSRFKNLCMMRVLNFLIRYFSNYYTLHRSDLAARAAPLDPRLTIASYFSINSYIIVPTLNKTPKF